MAHSTFSKYYSVCQIWATCLRHTVTKCHMWAVTPCNATPTGHRRHGPGPTERCCPPGSGSHTTCVVCRGRYRNDLLMITAFSHYVYDNLNACEGQKVVIVWNKNSWHLPSYLTCCRVYMLGCTLWRYLCRVPGTECCVVIAGGHTTGHCVTTCLVIFPSQQLLSSNLGEVSFLDQCLSQTQIFILYNWHLQKAYLLLMTWKYIDNIA